MKLVCA